MSQNITSILHPGLGILPGADNPRVCAVAIANHQNNGLGLAPIRFPCVGLQMAAPMGIVHGAAPPARVPSEGSTVRDALCTPQHQSFPPGIRSIERTHYPGNLHWLPPRQQQGPCTAHAACPGPPGVYRPTRMCVKCSVFRDLRGGGGALLGAHSHSEADRMLASFGYIVMASGFRDFRVWMDEGEGRPDFVVQRGRDVHFTDIESGDESDAGAALNQNIAVAALACAFRGYRVSISRFNSKAYVARGGTVVDRCTDGSPDHERRSSVRHVEYILNYLLPRFTEPALWAWSFVTAPANNLAGFYPVPVLKIRYDGYPTVDRFTRLWTLPPGHSFLDYTNAIIAGAAVPSAPPGQTPAQALAAAQGLLARAPTGETGFIPLPGDSLELVRVDGSVHSQAAMLYHILMSCNWCASLIPDMHISPFAQHAPGGPAPGPFPGVPFPAPRVQRYWRGALADWEQTGLVWTQCFSPVVCERAPGPLGRFPGDQVYPDELPYSHDHFAQRVAVPPRPLSYVFRVPNIAVQRAQQSALAGANVERAPAGLASPLAPVLVLTAAVYAASELPAVTIPLSYWTSSRIILERREMRDPIVAALRQNAAQGAARPRHVQVSFF